MKALKRSVCILLALILMSALSVCASAETKPAAQGPEAYAGEYTFLCARFSAAYIGSMYKLGDEINKIPDQYVAMPKMEGETVTLKADGTGYLYWGENNQGPIDWWKMDGDAITFKAGVAVIEGTIVNGVMTLTIEDGFAACFAAPGADSSGVKPITLDKFASILKGEEPAAPAPAELPLEGEYEAFAVQIDNALVYAADLGFASAITLSEGGTGSMSQNEETMDISTWTADGERFSITMADGSSAEGKIHGGVIELDIYGSGYMILCYAKEGADISGYAPMTLEEYKAKPDSMLYALWESLDADAGVHLNYSMHTDYMDADQSFDVHGKDGMYYSRRTTRVSGYEDTLVTFFRDGTAYNLYPENMTGIVVTKTSSSAVTENTMLMDHLFSEIHSYAARKDYTTETRELDGVSYTAELFPATGYTAEAAFYFGDDGRLAFCFKGAPVIKTAAEIGETVYTVYAIDEAVDEALFDISGYAIG